MCLNPGKSFWILVSVLDSRKFFGFWQVFLDSGKCFGFWQVFWILASVFRFWQVFLDSGKFFGFWEVFFDSGKCFRILGSVLSLWASVTKALFVLEKLWRLGTPLLPSMPTITLSRSLISTAFFSNNSHSFNTFFISFISPFLYIFHQLTFHVSSVEGCKSTVESSCFFFKTLREHFYCILIWKKYWYLRIFHL